MAEKACHAFASTTRFGLTQALGLMFDFFANTETNLGRAGWLLLLEFIGGASLGVVLSEGGFNSDLIVPIVWFVNLFATWFLVKAAQRQGRSALLYALSAIGPPAAIFAFFSLYNRDVLDRLDRAGETDYEA
jgi:hypothetical protein